MLASDFEQAVNCFSSHDLALKLGQQTELGLTGRDTFDCLDLMHDRLERIGDEMRKLVLIESELPLANLTLPRLILRLPVAQDYDILHDIINDHWIGGIVVYVYVQMAIEGMRKVLN